MPTPSSEIVRRRMARQRRRDTEPELMLRRELHRRGLRFRVDQRIEGLPRERADIVFTRAKVAVFVDGCFWHRCPEHATLPKSNASWWADKLQANVERDRAADATLSELGWTVLRFWEHEAPFEAADRIEPAVRRASIRPFRDQKLLEPFREEI